MHIVNNGLNGVCRKLQILFYLALYAEGVTHTSTGILLSLMSYINILLFFYISHVVFFTIHCCFNFFLEFY